MAPERYQVELEVESDDLMRDLRRWLQGERKEGWELGASAKPPAPNQMGVMELLTIVASSGGLAAVLRSINTWIKYRQPRVTVVLREENGNSVEVNAQNGGDITEIMKALDR